MPTLMLTDEDWVKLNQRRDVRFEIRMPVDSTGRGDPETATFSWNVSDETREEYRRWLRQLKFEPATQGGRKVNGVYVVKLRIRS